MSQSHALISSVVLVQKFCSVCPLEHSFSIYILNFTVENYLQTIPHSRKRLRQLTDTGWEYQDLGENKTSFQVSLGLFLYVFVFFNFMFCKLTIYSLSLALELVQ